MLEPNVEDMPGIHQLQTSLQMQVGGRIHRRVHLTCQRFSIEDGASTKALVRQLAARIAPLPPIPVRAGAFVVMESVFWKTRLLRWQIQVTEEMRRLLTAIEAGLASAGVQPHYRVVEVARSMLVTALEDLPEEVNLRPAKEGLPLSLFTGRRVVLSRIVGQRRFEILATLPLGGDGGGMDEPRTVDEAPFKLEEAVAATLCRQLDRGAEGSIIACRTKGEIADESFSVHRVWRYRQGKLVDESVRALTESLSDDRSVWPPFTFVCTLTSGTSTRATVEVETHYDRGLTEESRGGNAQRWEMERQSGVWVVVQRESNRFWD